MKKADVNNKQEKYKEKKIRFSYHFSHPSYFTQSYLLNRKVEKEEKIQIIRYTYLSAQSLGSVSHVDVFDNNKK